MYLIHFIFVLLLGPSFPSPTSRIVILAVVTCFIIFARFVTFVIFVIFVGLPSLSRFKHLLFLFLSLVDLFFRLLFSLLSLQLWDALPLSVLSFHFLVFVSLASRFVIFHRRSQDFSKGGLTVSKWGYSPDCHVDLHAVLLIQTKVLKKGPFNYGQDIVMAFSPPVVGCLVKKTLAKGGGHGHPRTPLAKSLAYIRTCRRCTFCIENFGRSVGGRQRDLTPKDTLSNKNEKKDWFPISS